MKNNMLLISIGLFTTAASAACYIAAAPVSCCSLVGSFDGTGNCSPWAHSCPDVPTTNPMADQVTQVGIGQGGKKSPPTNTPMSCTYQPKKCKFIGCSNDGPVATAGCTSQTPGTLNCPSGPPA